jgi:hypothetical protein
VIHLYAIAEAPVPPLGGLAGVRGTAVRGLACGALWAAYGALDAEPAADPPALLAHERVVEALMGAGPVLPARFGTALAGERELHDVLEQRAGRFAELLEGVRDCVELSVRLLPGTDGADAPGDGREWVQSRRAAQALAERVHRPLAALARSSHEPHARPGGVLAAAYLVPAPAVAGFAARVGELRESDPALDMSCTGPWPPYSFVGPG